MTNLEIVAVHYRWLDNDDDTPGTVYYVRNNDSGHVVAICQSRAQAERLIKRIRGRQNHG